MQLDLCVSPVLLPQTMEALNEAKSQFDKRTELVLDGTCIHLRPLSIIITEYAVTRYQLFEEAMLCKYSRNDAEGTEQYASLQDEIKLLAVSHAVVAQFLQAVKSILSTSPYQLYDALGLSCHTFACNRISCYYQSGGCTCKRPLFRGRIAQPLGFF